ncbi:MAG: hypothetical protein GXY07_14960, partial [Candidatus Hydrogenedentes bacterium]|nr:hypothetical protein [Candidatus Hydrogenedentota bacterium]
GEEPAEGEGEVLPEGEGEVPAEGEGEEPAEGEGEVSPEGEDENDACGCCSATDKALNLKVLLEKTLGDWLLIGMALMGLLSLSTLKK